jgi:N-acetylglucosaminyldiphosphoundecaprenol N-acetyl-beta-D-mannosaminyltransferase
MSLHAFADLLERGSLFTGSVEEAADFVIAHAQKRDGGYFCLCNVHVLATADSEPEVAVALRDAAAAFPDGAPVAWLARRARRGTERISGADLMEAVLARGRAVALKHALFGSTQEVAEALQRRLSHAFPGVRIIGTAAPSAESLRNGYPWTEWLRELDADVIWVGLGAPKQELWMAANAHAVDASFVGVGGAFDFLSGTKPRAPRWMQRAGLEWLHRLMSEPRRLAPRYFSTNTRFLASLARTLVIGGGLRRG